ncbi:MAG: RNA polymerase sigma factor [Phycisphaerales bacterium JB063]
MARRTEAAIPDPDRLKRLLEEHGRGLYALLFKLTRSHDTTDDLFQELFARLGRSTGWHHADDPVAYAYRSARNLAFEHRRRRRSEALVLTGQADTLVDPPTDDHPPDAAMIRREEVAALLDALAQLDDPWRTALTLRYLEDQPYERIADQLGKQTQAQSRSVVQKGLAKLRTLIEKGQHDG